MVLTHACRSDSKPFKLFPCRLGECIPGEGEKLHPCLWEKFVGQSPFKCWLDTMTNPFFSLKTIMQKTAILKASPCFLRICPFLNVRGEMREKGSFRSPVKVRRREWPLIILCSALVNLLGSHELTSSIFQMQQQKDSSPCPPAPTSGSHTPVGSYFSGEMAFINVLIFLLVSPKTINEEMHQQQ
uniref:Uncharacterized protein n=1 Tax=Pipistrellus kuhlii TaxID=59472 RepID=A0A7J7YME7_PIPKU|nr:hypothetical protein mPipKuh1_010099 [Pipistrellus kuhlii]